MSIHLFTLHHLEESTCAGNQRSEVFRETLYRRISSSSKVLCGYNTEEKGTFELSRYEGKRYLGTLKDQYQQYSFCF